MSDSSDHGSNHLKALGRKTLQLYDNLLDWYNRLAFIVKIVIIFSVPSVPVLGYYFFDGKITVDFNPIDNCNRGSLYNLQESTDLPSSLMLMDGAAELSICDSEALTARKSKFLAEFVAKYSGCVRFDKEKDELHMLLNPLAVCRSVSTNKQKFFCDGAKDEARKSPAQSTLAESRSKLHNCTDDFFKVWSRPK